MNLTMIELHKIFRSRVVLAAAVFLLVMDVFVYGNTGNSYYTVFGKDSKAHIAEAQEDGAYFKGEIADQGFDYATVEEKYPGSFIKEEVLSSRSYTRYEPAESDAKFSENARFR